MQDRNITICDGARSRIVCAMQANRRHARYCVFRHLRLDESSAATSGGGGGRSSGGGRALFTAHCRPTAAWAQAKARPTLNPNPSPNPKRPTAAWAQARVRVGLP